MKTYEKLCLQRIEFLSSKEEYCFYYYILNKEIDPRDVFFWDWEERSEAKDRRDIWYSENQHIFWDGADFKQIKKVFNNDDYDVYYKRVYCHSQPYWELVPNCPPMRSIIQMDEAQERGLIEFNEDLATTEIVEPSTYFEQKQK